jgi:hypothetical protein
LCQQYLQLVVARLQLLNDVLLLILRCLQDTGVVTRAQSVLLLNGHWYMQADTHSTL